MTERFKVKVTVKDEDMRKAIEAHYDQNHSQEDLWLCPLCGGEIDPVCDENDGEYTEDTYDCRECELLITHRTPSKYTEYWQVPWSKWTVLVEDTI